MTAICIDALTPADPIAQRLCDIFLKNRWDFISAPLLEDKQLQIAWTPGQIPKPKKAQWRTERRYPMKSRVFYRRWQNLSEIIGVRFTTTTAYAVIDIDVGSKYHPRQNPSALRDLQLALETIGLVRTVLIRSSHSEGLHLYLPLNEEVGTFDLAVALKFCLESCGFSVCDGQLEIFPNVKAYGVQTKILYKGHRLPLQPGTGSYLLNEDLEPIGDRLPQFFEQWDLAASGQDISVLTKAMSVARLNRLKKPRRRLTKVEEWRQDLENTLKEGWTGPGQTNHLLKEIGCHAVVFLSLSGDDLSEHISKTAKELPGYRKWCQHQQEIERRAYYWSRSVEKYYWPLEARAKSKGIQPQAPSHNEKLSIKARSMIASVVAKLEAQKALPAKTTARIQAISAAIRGISRGTLYSHKDLWHPDYQSNEMQSVTTGLEGTEPQIASASSSEAEAEKPCYTEELRTKSEIMKCLPRQTEPFAPKKINLLPLRGVRGESQGFPQPILSKRSVSTNPLPSDANKDLQPSKNASPGTPSPLDETIRGIQRQVQRLQWPYERLTEFIARYFDGRRRSQLRDDELFLLLYRLQNADV